MDSLEIEKKYIEERVKVLRALEKSSGKKIIDRAADEKKRLIEKRIKEEYKNIIPVNMDQFFKIIFSDFEGINRITNFTVLEKTKNHLKVRMNKCWYAEIYRKLKAEDIGLKMVCMMDPVMNKALNPKIKMSRPKKLMLGHDCCIFEYWLKE
ncbi:MAG: hypothetical protein GTN38_03775 [Candidatus Aenigmarchaeota archaeon]|nr:hypothetical protein [Candidatus Aenigmarchaeota archaeon]NIP40781.1 hypothetical protein [Candidatus Aenigmarchaeota archaeon]NIQ17371.1 hypothetical protein [Candidatus Aenigmarchaeota archaeon]NIS73484.1 hypothetical protein [Candidatus Aenigmarchaeota archaeon]